MASVGIYLTFPRQTEEVFNYYKSIFGGEFSNPGIRRYGSVPGLAEADKNLVMHVELAILGGYLLMGMDAPESMGFEVSMGNNTYISLSPDTRAETKQLFDALSTDGIVTMPLEEMAWGSYYGFCQDRYGIQWRFDCRDKK